MKKMFLVGAFALFGAVNAQENSIKVNPFALFGGSDLVSYERAVGNSSSVGIGAGIGGFKLGGYKYSNAGVSAFYRYYFGGTSLKGWYGFGGISYNGGKVKFNDSDFGGFYVADKDKSETKFNAFGANVRAGYQWVWNSGFTLDLNAGLGYTSFKYKDNYDNTGINLKASGVLPTVGVALGYSFENH